MSLTSAAPTALIHHCLDTTELVGGTEIYVASLLEHRPPGVSDRILTSLLDVDQSQFKLLHIHRRETLLEYQGKCPAIYTLHNHSSYCSSGTKYLRHKQRCCERTLSPLGCAWGHFIDGCGSRRPLKFFRKYGETEASLAHLKAFNVPIVANSHYVRQQLIKNGLFPHQVKTLHCTIKPPKASPTRLSLDHHRNCRFLFVGRLDPMKGLEWLLRALATSKESIHLDIAGEGWYRPYLESLSSNLQLEPRITWHGWCNQDQLAELYQNCTALVVPSIWPEPAGLVTLESYSQARPVIASAIGGIPEYVGESKAGLLVRPNDIKGLAEAMLRLNENYSLARSMGDEGYKYLTESLNFETHIQTLQRLYSEAIDTFNKTFQ